MVAIAPLCVSMGEPAGIGGDVALTAHAAMREGGMTLPAFFMIDDPARLRRLAARLGLAIAVEAIAAPQEAAAVFARALPVLPLGIAVDVAPGQPDRAAAPAVIAAIERGVAVVRAGSACGLVTLPIHKGVLYEAGFRFPGHTEFLAHLAAASGHPPPRPVMMLASDRVDGGPLRVVPVTIHIPLAAVPGALDIATIVDTGRIVAAALRLDEGIERPRLAVAGLNPHAGEGGSIGREELDIIAPAVATLRAEGIDADGPFPADSLFHPGVRARSDAVLCMYHDQALIPLKTLDFDGGVNLTLGLPFLRSSPDHGTAFDIAGTGRARADSFVAALHMAARMAARRSVRAAS